MLAHNIKGAPSGSSERGARRTVDVVRAFDRAPLESLPTDDAAALDAKLDTADRLFRDRSRWLPAHERLAILYRLAALLAERQDGFARQIAAEGGKPLVDARIEAARAVDGLRDAAAELRVAMAGREIPMGLTAASAKRWAFTTREPIGVVAAISAFNHPLNLVVHQVAPAIAVGCPVIVKPASATPLSCRDFVALVHEAGLPPEWCQFLLPDSNSLSERFATDPRVAFLSFIGSAAVGWSLHSKLAPGTRSALEHGGVAPVIVDRSADLDAVIEPLAKGGYYHAGQVCVSVQRILVHESLRAGFVERFAARVAALRVGDPALAETEVGPLIQPKEVDRVAAWVDEAVAGGATVATGRERLSATTYRPTVLVEPALDATVSTQEVFGPVTCVYGFSDLDRAIGIANALPVAFQASVFARDMEAAMRVADRIDASAVMVNDHTAFRTDWMPFAGRKHSGYGVGGIPYSMREMTQEKMIVLRHP